MTSADIRKALRVKYAAPEWALFFEVCNETGSARRIADAVAMNLWRSRGLDIHGFEIKVSRSDLKSELRTPAKAEAVGRFCDYWWIVVPGTLKVDDFDLPAKWGLMAVDGRGCVTKVKAKKLDALKPTRVFIAAILRRACERIADLQDFEQKAHDVDEKLRKKWNEAYTLGEEHSKAVIEHLKERIKMFDHFENETGITLNRWNFGQMMRASEALTALVKTYGGLDSARNYVRRMHKEMGTALELMEALCSTPVGEEVCKVTKPEAS